MLCRRHIVQSVGIGISIANLLVLAPKAASAQYAPTLNYNPQVFFLSSSVAPLRLGVLRTKMSDGARDVASATRLRSYSLFQRNSPAHDSTAAGRVRRRLKHTGIGAVTGAAIGVAIGAIASAHPSGQNCHDLCTNRGIGIAYLGGVGMVGGALIGAFWPTR